jgi:YihY family inner membrane protein
MASAAQNPPSARDRGARQQTSETESLLARLQARAKPALSFWTKLNNDWVFNLSAMLAYDFLMSLFPILLVLLSIAGFILGRLAPAQVANLESHLIGTVPGGSTVVTAVTQQLKASAGALLVIGIVVAAFTGSRLFIAIESCFGIIFRLRSRDILHQNLMALGMLLIYVVLLPVLSLGSVVPTAILHALGPLDGGTLGRFLAWLIGEGVSVLAACLFFGAIYIVVPPKKVYWSQVWKGTLVAAGLLVIYNILFPLYQSHFLHPGNYGSLAGFAIVILIYLYYVGFILLLGAEVNSWAAGQRETYGDIRAILHELQAHNTTPGAAGPTAGQPQEDLQGQKGAPAMENTDAAIHHERTDHNHDNRLPMPAEAHAPGPPHHAQQREPRWYQDDRRLTQGREQEEGKAERESHPNDGSAAAGGAPSTTGGSTAGAEAGAAPQA